MDELSVDVVDSRPATTFFIILDPAEGDVAADESTAYDDLPDVDRAVFERRGWGDPGFLGFGTSVRYLDEHVPDSALVPDPAYSVGEFRTRAPRTVRVHAVGTLGGGTRDRRRGD